MDNCLAIGETKILDLVQEEIEKYTKLDLRGLPTKMLGIELTWRNNEVVLTQTVSIETLAICHNVSGVKYSLPQKVEYVESIEESGEPINQKEF